MSATVSKANGVTVFTLTYDSQSAWPPLCQILKNLCCSPVFSTLSQRLRGVQRASQAVLGTLQIMVGLLSIGFGAILSYADANFLGPINCNSFPYWSGALFIVFGVICLLFEKYRSPCQVILNMILNLTGFGIALAAIVLYTINITCVLISRGGDYEINNLSLKDKIFLQGNLVTMVHIVIMCTFITAWGEEKPLQEIWMLMKNINLVLIVLSGLEIGVTMTSVCLEIKALHQGQNESTDDPELYKPLLEDVTAQPTV